jgi:hypothetical protein
MKFSLAILSALLTCQIADGIADAIASKNFIDFLIFFSIPSPF